MHPAHADEASDRDGQTILHMLDYVSVDYGGSVLYGKVLNEREYKEQLEFAEQAASLMNKMPEHPSQAALIVQATEIAKNVKDKSPANHVSELAEQLRKAVITTYHVPISPRSIPDTLPALALFQKLCVPCHGTNGHGDGPLSKVVTPKPADFYNENRMEQRSIYGLYNSISLGVGRTAMTAFTQLSDEDRWSLAFLVSNFRTTPDEIEYGQKIWKARNFQGPTPDLAALTTTTENQILARYGAQTNAVFTYLRSEPQALKATPHATLIFATEQLDSAFNRYREGNKSAAQQLAISAYLDGFEPMEISLDNLDHPMRLNIESEMMNVRQLISSDMPVESVAKKIEQTKALLKQADERVRQGDLSIVKVFTSAIFILMKESLGGILVLAGLMAIVVNIGQRKARFYIYAGWGSASLLGGLTWVAATWMTELSGMSREITSAVTALISAAMLSYFGLWLYNKTHWQTWQAFLHDQTDTRLRRRILWVLALLSFFVVYRAAFESALFYEALWIQTTASVKPVIWSGMLTASLLLVLIGWVIFSVGMALSSKALFTSTSILLAVLSIVFAGQGVVSLQRAGIVMANKINFAAIPLLGITPTTQGLSVQLVVMTILALGYLISIWRRNN
jgi:high-affinity iron transporter